MKKIILSVTLLLLCTTAVYAASINGDFNGNPIVKLFINDEEVVPSGDPAFLYDGNVMIPASMLRNMGFTVNWNGDYNSAYIVPPDPVTVTKVVYVTVPQSEPTNDQNSTTDTTDQTTSDGTDSTTDTTVDTSTDQTTDTTTDQTTNTTDTQVDNTTTAPPDDSAQTTNPPDTTQTTTQTDNTAQCQSIKDDYAGKIAMLSYKGYNRGKLLDMTNRLEYERDNELTADGCN